MRRISGRVVELIAISYGDAINKRCYAVEYYLRFLTNCKLFGFLSYLIHSKSGCLLDRPPFLSRLIGTCKISISVLIATHRSSNSHRKCSSFCYYLHNMQSQLMTDSHPQLFRMFIMKFLISTVMQTLAMTICKFFTMAAAQRETELSGSYVVPLLL